MALQRIGSVAALALGVVGCIPSGTEPPAVLQVRGTDIGAGWANVQVVRGGVAVAGARVVVNGVALEPSPHEVGVYSGQLPALLAPGDAVSLEVTSGDAAGIPAHALTVTGTGHLPDAPFILAAYTSAAVASDGDIVVTWTSPSDPDYFVAWATWWSGSLRLQAPGSARMLTIPKGALPPGADVSVAVFAYDDGTMEGDYAPFGEDPGMNVRAESGQLAVVTGASGPPGPTLEVRGQDMGEANACVVVTRGGQAVDDAQVAVNGVVLPLMPTRTGGYAGSFARVFAGDPIVLEVTRGALRVTGVGALPAVPFLTAPTNGAGVPAGQQILVRWTSPTDPSYFEVVADWSCGPSCGTGTEFTAAGTARELAIPPGALPTGSIQLRVFAYDDGAFTGDYAPFLQYPGMNIRAESGAVTISR